MNASDFVDGNQLRLLHTGAEYFSALETAIDQASQEIFLETYIFEYDSVGQRIAAALERAAARGVAVHLLIDGFGSLDFPLAKTRELLAKGVRLLIYRQEIFSFRLKRLRLRRLHRKLAVMDASVAFVGGINIIEDFTGPDITLPQFDYVVEIRGPLLQRIHAAARHLWTLVAWAHFKKRWTNYVPIEGQQQPAGQQRAAFVIRDNLRNRRSIEHSYLQAIDSANKEILIANAYFLPGINFRHALINAAQRGVRVVLLLQGKTEHIVQRLATRALYGSLLAAGIHIYEYRHGYLHAKVALIDQRWATVGSSNIDPFSLLLAREANIIIDDHEFALQLRDSLLRSMKRFHPVLRYSWGRRTWLARSINWLCYYFVRVTQGMLGYAREDNKL
ncbi:MAG: cardiolipin synthase ClsB [Nitrosomonas sp.]|nr:cardiolipin synthase ClsB [Nitrosomonas sp.]